jgi:hypothetical protein
MLNTVLETGTCGGSEHRSKVLTEHPVLVYPGFMFFLTVTVVLFLLLSSDYPLQSALRKIPGPEVYAFTSWALAYDAFHTKMVFSIRQLHQKYGPVVRISPNEVSFNSLTALRTIYGAGSGFERTRFYSMFDVYGTKNLFTFGPVKDHRERKKLLSHI